MAQLKITILILLSLFLISSIPSVEPSMTTKHNSKTMSYIESSCSGTLYRDLCIRCLARHVTKDVTIDGPRHLAHVALSVSLSRAQHTRGYLLNVAKELEATNKKNDREYETVQDCVNQITDSVDELTQAIKELRRLNGLRSSSTINDGLLWHISNVETWVSTALTDASSCVLSFPGRRMSKRMAAIKVKAQNVAEVTSNALTLFHSYASSYQPAASRTTNKP